MVNFIDGCVGYPCAHHMFSGSLTNSSLLIMFKFDTKLLHNWLSLIRSFPYLPLLDDAKKFQLFDDVTLVFIRHGEYNCDNLIRSSQIRNSDLNGLLYLAFEQNIWVC